MWLSGMVTIAFIGAVSGALSVYSRFIPQKNLLFYYLLFFFTASYLGFWAGPILFGWLPDVVAEVLRLFVFIAFGIVSFLSFHPVYGLFHKEDRMVWILLISVYFCSGWLLVAVGSHFFIFVVGFCIFISSLFFGLIGQTILQNRHPHLIWVRYFPIVILLFYAIIQLL